MNKEPHIYVKENAIFQRERDNYSKNLSILNISSYSDKNPHNTRNYYAIQTINPPIFKIGLKLNQLIHQFYFTIKF